MALKFSFTPIPRSCRPSPPFRRVPFHADLGRVEENAIGQQLAAAQIPGREKGQARPEKRRRVTGGGGIDAAQPQ